MNLTGTKLLIHQGDINKSQIIHLSTTTMPPISPAFPECLPFVFCLLSQKQNPKQRQFLETKAIECMLRWRELAFVDPLRWSDSSTKFVKAVYILKCHLQEFFFCAIKTGKA